MVVIISTYSINA